MAAGPEENGAESPGKKHWLSGPKAYIGAGAFMGLLAGITFFLMGLAEFQAGEENVGMAYMVLTGVFPVSSIIAGWLMGKN